MDNFLFFFKSNIMSNTKKLFIIDLSGLYYNFNNKLLIYPYLGYFIKTVLNRYNVGLISFHHFTKEFFKKTGINKEKLIFYERIKYKDYHDFLIKTNPFVIFSQISELVLFNNKLLLHNLYIFKSHINTNILQIYADIIKNQKGMSIKSLDKKLNYQPPLKSKNKNKINKINNFINNKLVLDSLNKKSNLLSNKNSIVILDIDDVFMHSIRFNHKFNKDIKLINCHNYIKLEDRFKVILPYTRMFINKMFKKFHYVGIWSCSVDSNIDMFLKLLKIPKNKFLFVWNRDYCLKSKSSFGNFYAYKALDVLPFIFESCNINPNKILLIDDNIKHKIINKNRQIVFKKLPNNNPDFDLILKLLLKQINKYNWKKIDNFDVPISDINSHFNWK